MFFSTYKARKILKVPQPVVHLDVRSTKRCWPIIYTFAWETLVTRSARTLRYISHCGMRDADSTWARDFSWEYQRKVFRITLKNCTAIARYSRIWAIRIWAEIFTLLHTSCDAVEWCTRILARTRPELQYTGGLTVSVRYRWLMLHRNTLRNSRWRLRYNIYNDSFNYTHFITA